MQARICVRLDVWLHTLAFRLARRSVRLSHHVLDRRKPHDCLYTGLWSGKNRHPADHVPRFFRDSSLALSTECYKYDHKDFPCWPRS